MTLIEVRLTDRTTKKTEKFTLYRYKSIKEARGKIVKAIMDE